MSGTSYENASRTLFRILFSALTCSAVVLALPPAANAGVLFFDNDKPAFTAAMTAALNPFLGVEDFEGSTLTAPSNANLSNPLTQGVAKGVYPSGLTQPMTVQSNSLGASPTTPSSGFVMLAVPAGSRGAVSDVVVPASSLDSLDWILLDSRIKGIGLDLIILQDGGAARVQVYNQNNQLIGSFNGPADPSGSNFLGIQGTGSDRIGRINFLGTAGSFKRAAGDNAILFIPEPSGATMLCVAGLLAAVYRLARRKPTHLIRS